MLTREQWEARKKYIGGSDAAAVLGLSRPQWGTLLSVWAEKTGRVPYEEAQTLQQWYGTELEPIVAKRFTIETGKKVRPNNNKVTFHRKYPFIGCQTDYWLDGEDAILECKTVTAFKADEWSNEEIPTEYLIQAYHMIACTNIPLVYVAVLIGNHKFEIREVKRDKHIIDNLIAKEVSFWEKYVVTGEMPAEISYGDTDLLYRLFPMPEPEPEIELPDEVNVLCEDLEAMKQDRSSLEGRIGQQQNKIKAMLKDALRGSTGLWQVTWSLVEKPEHIVKATSYRQLRTKKIKEEGEK
jgi:putative phage-type endonuclease